MIRSGPYESGDMQINAIKTMSHFKSLSEGNLIPQWSGELNATYGYPLFLFTYPLPYYMGSLFHLIGFSFINSMKVDLALPYILSGMFMFLYLKEKFSDLSSLIGSIFYLFAPYHLVDLHFRATLGEMFAYIFLPLTLFIIDRSIHSNRMIYKISLSISVALLTLSHQAISLFFVPILSLYIIIFRKPRSPFTILTALIPVLIGLLLSSFYWLPVIFETKFTHQPEYAKTMEFSSLSQLIFSPWRYGLLFQGHYGELSFIIGYAHILIIIISIYLIIKRRIKKMDQELITFSLLLIILLSFMTTSYSKMIWDLVPIIKNFQFSWRLLAIIIFFNSIMAAVVVNSIKEKKIVVLLGIIAISYTMLNWGNRGTIPAITDNSLYKTLPESTAIDEGLAPAIPKWTNSKFPFMAERPLYHLEISSGTGEFIQLERTSTHHQYIINAKTNLLLRENTIYFPGWIILDNHKIITFNYSGTLTPGVISFNLSKGLHLLDVKYIDTQIVQLGKIISAITLIGMIPYFFSKRTSDIK